MAADAVAVVPYGVVGKPFRADTPRVWSPTSLSRLAG